MLDRLTVRAALGALLVFLLANASSLRAGEFLFVDDFENTATLTGRVLDTNAFVDTGVELPIAGVLVTLLDVPGSSITGPNGSFLLRNVPPGEQVLDLDTGGATPAPTGDTYAGFRERIVLNGFNNVERPFYLPRIDASSLTTIDPTQTTVVENPNLGISMTVAAGSAMDEDGQMFDGQLSISEVPAGLAPAALPDFLEPGLLITVQPVGVTFSPPAPITFPNFDNLPPGSETDLWSLDPELGQFAIVGTGQVSADGERIETISGGIVAADWHAPPPPPPRPADEDGDTPPRCKGCCPSCSGEVGSSVDLFDGGFSESFSLPGIFSLIRPLAPEFVYQSKRAYPVSVIPVNSGIVSRAATPNMISYRGYIDGELAQNEIFIDTGTLAPATDEPFRIAVPFDNTARPTGIHDANVMVTSIYDRSRISASNPTALTVVNAIDSPFGAGWNLAGLDRLILDAPGTIRERLLLVQGNGGSIQFEEQLTGVNPDGIITIVIRQNTSAFWAGETNALIAILDGMGLESQLIVGTDFTPEILDESRLVIFMDFTFRFNADDPIIQQMAAVMKLAQDNGVPTFYIGQEPAFLNNPGNAPDFMELWLGLWNLLIGTATAGGEGLVTVTDPSHPIFDGPAGALAQFNISGDVDVTRGSNTGETTIAASANADIVLVEESAFGGRNVTMNTTIQVNQPVADQDELALIVENAVSWLLQSPSLTSGFFGEGEFAAVDGEYSGIVRDPDTGTFTRVLKDGTLHLFDADGLLTSAIDRNGNTTAYSYDGQGRIQTITNPVGRVTTFAYDGNGHLDTVTDPADRVTAFDIDAAGDLSEVTFPDGSTRAFGYDSRHLMTAQTDARGFTTQYQFDGLGFFTQSIQPDGSVRQIQAAQRIGVVDTGSGLGSASNPAPIVRPESASSVLTDPIGRALVAETGKFGEPVHVTGFDGLPTTIARDTDGNPTEVTSASGFSASYGYDTFGNRTSIANGTAGGQFRMSYWTDFNKVLSVQDPFGNTTLLDYDAAGNLTRLLTPAGKETLYTYASDGLIESTTHRSGYTTAITYGPQRLPEQIVANSGPVTRSTTFAYADNGYPHTITDAEGHVTGLDYDPMGRVIQLTLPDGELIGIGYDGDGRLTSVTPPQRPDHVFTYTDSGRLASYEPPAIGGIVRTSYAYNAAGELVSTNLPDGRSITQTYDAAGRLATRQSSAGTVVLSYASNTGLPSAASTSDGVALAFGYSGGILVQETISGPFSASYTITLDPARRISSESINSSETVAYAYNADNDLTQAGTYTIDRDPASGQITGTQLDSVTDDWLYAEFGELSGYEARFGGTTLYEYSLVKDSLGRVSTKTETIGGVTTTYQYDYDSRGRLVSVLSAGSSVDYSYDANGNRLTRDDGITIEAGSFDEQDRALTYAARSYSYRSSGELMGEDAGGGLTGFHYDEIGNLRSLDLPDGRSISYVIDPLDRRIGKRIDGVLVQGFVYRSDLSPVAELDGAGNLVSRFVYATSPNVPDFMTRNGSTYRLLRDHLGSVRLVVDVLSGIVAQRLDYDEFGRVLADTNPGFQPFGFAGGLYDMDTGLVRFGARDYDAFLGRWTAKDPLLTWGFDTNLYAYVANDPINRVDPTGLQTDSNDVSGRQAVRILAKKLGTREAQSQLERRILNKVIKSIGGKNLTGPLGNIDTAALVCGAPIAAGIADFQDPNRPSNGNPFNPETNEDGYVGFLIASMVANPSNSDRWALEYVDTTGSDMVRPIPKEQQFNPFGW